MLNSSFNIQGFYKRVLGSCSRHREVRPDRCWVRYKHSTDGRKWEGNHHEELSKAGKWYFKLSQNLCTTPLPSHCKAGDGCKRKDTKDTFKTCIWHSNCFRQCEHQRIHGQRFHLRTGDRSCLRYCIKKSDSMISSNSSTVIQVYLQINVLFPALTLSSVGAS